MPSGRRSARCAVAVGILAVSVVDGGGVSARTQLPLIGVRSTESELLFVMVSCDGRRFGRAALHTGLGEDTPVAWSVVLREGATPVVELPVANALEGYEVTIPLSRPLDGRRLHSLYGDDESGASAANFAFTPGQVRDGSVLTYEGNSPVYSPKATFGADFCDPEEHSTLVAGAVVGLLAVGAACLLVRLLVRRRRTTLEPKG